MNKDLQNKFNKVSGLLNDSVVSMLLGSLVVILIALLAYNYFKTRAVTSPVGPLETEISEEATTGELTAPTSIVNLPTTYTVVPGDSLWSISEKFYNDGHKYTQIAKENNISNPRAIEVGQKLIISGAQSLSAITGNSYTVVSGDNLWQISLRAYGDGFRWTQIASANNLVNPRLIHVGNVLTIPR